MTLGHKSMGYNHSHNLYPRCLKRLTTIPECGKIRTFKGQYDSCNDYALVLSTIRQQQCKTYKLYRWFEPNIHLAARFSYMQPLGSMNNGTKLARTTYARNNLRQHYLL